MASDDPAAILPSATPVRSLLPKAASPAALVPSVILTAPIVCVPAVAAAAVVGSRLVDVPEPIATEFSNAATAPWPRAVASVAVASALSPKAVALSAEAMESSPTAVAFAKLPVMLCTSSVPPIASEGSVSVSNVKPASAPWPIAVAPSPKAWALSPMAVALEEVGLPIASKIGVIVRSLSSPAVLAAAVNVKPASESSPTAVELPPKASVP